MQEQLRPPDPPLPPIFRVPIIINNKNSTTHFLVPPPFFCTAEMSWQFLGIARTTAAKSGPCATEITLTLTFFFVTLLDVTNSQKQVDSQKVYFLEL